LVLYKAQGAYTCLNYGAGLFILQKNFIELQLHYLNCGAILELQQNCGCISCIVVCEFCVSFCIADGKTAELLFKKKPYGDLYGNLLNII
jgi:hypothetical protein